jgi:hypothetical protein
MKIIKKKFTLFLMLILVLIFHLNNSFLDFYTLLKFAPHERMTKAYGDCGGESYGFIKKIKKIHNQKLNLKILNDNPNFTFNNSTWFAYNVNKDYDKDKIILINNVNSLKYLDKNKYQLFFKNKNLGYFKILHKDNNCFYLQRI